MTENPRTMIEERIIIDTTNGLESKKIESNKKKEEHLNKATRKAFQRLNLKNIELTQNNNFKNKLEHHTADFLIQRFIALENKNWDCYNYRGYTVTKNKADSQILSRFDPYDVPCKVLIIGKPKWGKGVKEYVESKDIHIIELGFQVNSKSIKEATQIIYRQLILFFKRCFGYSSICNKEDSFTSNNPILPSKTSKFTKIHYVTEKLGASITTILGYSNKFKAKLPGILAPLKNKKESLPSDSKNNKNDSSNSLEAPSSEPISKCVKCQTKMDNSRFRSPVYCDDCIKQVVRSEFYDEIVIEVNDRQKKINQYAI